MVFSQMPPPFMIRWHFYTQKRRKNTKNPNREKLLLISPLLVFVTDKKEGIHKKNIKNENSGRKFVEIRAWQEIFTNKAKLHSGKFPCLINTTKIQKKIRSFRLFGPNTHNTL